MSNAKAKFLQLESLRAYRDLNCFFANLSVMFQHQNQNASEGLPLATGFFQRLTPTHVHRACCPH